MDSDQSSEIEGLFLKEVTKEDDAHQKSSGISDNLYSKECGVHGLLVFVMDTPVQFGTNSRAFYSTPHGLAVGPSENREEGLGVWCTVKTIPKGVLFGPIEGSVPVEKGSVEKLYTQMVQERNLAKLGAFDESKSNWMRFVNFAKTPAERNLTVSQYNGKFYYKVCQSIEPAHELLIWYGEDEAASKSMQKQNLLKEKQENVNTCGEYYDQQIKQEYKAEVQENQDIAHPECCGGLAESEHNPGDIEQIQSCHNGDFREPSLVPNKPFDSLNENAGRSLENEETLSCCLSSLMNTKNSTLCSQLYSSQKTHENRDAGAQDSSPDQIGSTRDQKHFKCEYCGKLFLQKADVMIHMLTHTDSVNEVFQANGICDSEMSSSLNGYLGDGREEAFEGILVDGLKLPNHILFQDKPSLFGQGMECNETSKLENEHGSKHETMLNFTSSAYDKEKHFDCEYCTRSFLRKEQLMTHRRTHTGEKPFACEQCGRAFAEKSNLNEHRRTHTGIRPHSCSWCGKAFYRRSHLKVHLRRHTGEKPYTCDVCRHTFVDTSSLQRHKCRSDSVNEAFLEPEIHNTQKPTTANGFQSVEIEKMSGDILVNSRKQLNNILSQDKPNIFNETLNRGNSKLENKLDDKDERVLEFTSSLHDKEKHFDCEYCTRSFLRKEQLMTHRRTHTGEKPFACEQCGRAFAEKSNLNEHRRTHTGIRPHSCSWCGKAFYRRSHLKVHLRRHTGEKPYTCDVCRHTFVDTSSLQRHKCRSGSVNDAFMEPEVCDTQKNTSANGSRGVESEALSGDILVNCLKQLSNILSENKPSIFDETLNKDSPKPESSLDDRGERVLEFTSSICDKEKHFNCEYCTRSFLRKEQLMMHRRTHTGEKPFACEQCGRAFAEKSNLNEHRRSHTGIRPYSCSLCNKAFYRSSHLKVHLRRHTGEKPYKCDVCQYTFVDSSSLQRHRRFPSACYKTNQMDSAAAMQNKPMKEHICHSNTDTIQGEDVDIKRDADETKQAVEDLAYLCPEEFPNQNCEKTSAVEILSGSSFTRISDHSLDKRYKVCNFPVGAMKNLNYKTDSQTISRPRSQRPQLTFKEVLFSSHQDQLPPGEKYFKCEYCGRRFLRKAQLTMHRRVHTGEKPFLCHDCGRGFAEKSNLNDHRRTHTGERPYECTFCVKAFHRSTHLKVHLRRHTGEKPYKCEDCKKTFVDSSSLQRHRRFPSDSCSLLGKQHSEKEVCDMEILLDNNSGCNSHSSSSEQKTVPNIYFGICKREKSEHFNYPLISESGRYVKNNPNALFDGLLLDPVQPALKQMEERENQQISNVQ